MNDSKIAFKASIIDGRPNIDENMLDGDLDAPEKVPILTKGPMCTIFEFVIFY